VIDLIVDRAEIGCWLGRSNTLHLYYSICRDHAEDCNTHTLTATSSPFQSPAYKPSTTQVPAPTRYLSRLALLLLVGLNRAVAQLVPSVVPLFVIYNP